MMGFFSKLFGKKQPTGATVEVTQSWHYAGDGDCPPTRLLSVVQIPGPAPQDAAGFFNLGVYRVTGHIMNTQTGRQNKKVVKVNALSKNDAESAALELGVLPPLSIEVVDTLNQAPNEYQASNAKEYGIAIPPGAVDADVRTMVDRSGDRSPAPGLALFCTRQRILFSRYIGETDLVNLACFTLSDRDKVALFAHAVHCSLSGCQIGDPANDPLCYSFADSAGPSTLSDVLKRCPSDLPVPRKGTKAWNAVNTFYSAR